MKINEYYLDGDSSSDFYKWVDIFENNAAFKGIQKQDINSKMKMQIFILSINQKIYLYLFDKQKLFQIYFYILIIKKNNFHCPRPPRKA